MDGAGGGTRLTSDSDASASGGIMHIVAQAIQIDKPQAALICMAGHLYKH